jgi:EAL domain-containing protein (putative c-di-GMP-specific phosphodiesterase class I)
MYGLTLRGARTAAEMNRGLESILAACFAEPFMIGGEELRVACRAGVALHPDDGADADALLRNAEAALRRSKGAGERIVFYAPEMNVRVAEALAIENKLRRAIERREFVLHYQPKVALASSRITGLEALIRWQDPDQGLIAPGRFIPVLEETGMIVEVGRWAVEQAFVDLRAWAAQGINVPRVAVNVSSIQLQRKDFVDSIIEEIRRGGNNPEWLELEITESLVMRNVEDSTRKLSILRGMGVKVAIDDFGTGYSSLSYLGRLPVDTLKIDRSFISGVAMETDSVTVVSTILALAHGLKLNVVAEGVETREQADMLRRFRCDEAQGYFYSRPIPAGEIQVLLRAGGALPSG